MSHSPMFQPLAPDIDRGFKQQRSAAIHVLSTGPFIDDPDSSTACFVYAATNLITGHVYVGLTSRGIRARRYQHFWRARRGLKSKFAAAIRCYGEDSFVFAPIRECRDYADGLRKEAWAITDLRPEYNLTAGGGGIKGYKFDPASVEARVALLRGKPGHPCPQWLKEANAERARLRRGRPISERARAALLGNVKKATVAKQLAVLCESDGRVYASATEAAAAYGLTTGQISAYCRGAHHSRRGLRFSYAGPAS